MPVPVGSKKGYISRRVLKLYPRWSRQPSLDTLYRSILHRPGEHARDGADNGLPLPLSAVWSPSWKGDVPEKANSGRTKRSRCSGSAVSRMLSARLRLLSTSPTRGANCRHPIIILGQYFSETSSWFRLRLRIGGPRGADGQQLRTASYSFLPKAMRPAEDKTTPPLRYPTRLRNLVRRDIHLGWIGNDNDGNNNDNNNDC